MKINFNISADENILALVQDSNPALKDGVDVGEPVVLEGGGDRNTTVTLTTNDSGAYTAGESVDVSYTRLTVVEHLVVPEEPIVVPTEIVDTGIAAIGDYVLEQCLDVLEADVALVTSVDTEELTVTIGVAEGYDKLLIGGVSVNYTPAIPDLLEDVSQTDLDGFVMQPAE